MRLKRTFIVALLMTVALVGAVRAEDKNPNIKLKGIALKHLDATSLVAETTVSLEIENPGPAFSIKEASYRLKLNDQDAAEGKHDEEIKVPAESSITVDFPLTVNLAALPGVTWGTITDGLKLNYQLDAEFNMPLLSLIKPRIKTSFNGTLPIGDMAMEWTGRLKDRLFGKPNP